MPPLLRRKFRSQPQKPFSKKTIFFITVIVTVVLSLQSFIFLEKNIKEPLMSVARIRVKQVATEAINQAIANQTGETDLDQLVTRWTNFSGDVTGLALNYGEHMKITSQVVDIVTKALEERVHIEEHIPLGQALDSAIISAFGPKIPLKFESAGAPRVELGTRREDAGINMLLITVFVRITAEVMIYIPFDTGPEVVSTEIPISYILVKGDVPMYYFDAKGNPLGGSGNSVTLPPSIALPQSVPMEGMTPNQAPADAAAAPQP